MNAAPIVLASSSPRRAELLQQVGIAFEVLEPHVNESQIVAGDPVETALLRARAKLSAALEIRGDAEHAARLVLAADTVVFMGTQTFGKPKSPAEARAIVGALAGRTHTVVTACAWSAFGRNLALTDTADVTFLPLSEPQLAAYVATEQWRGVAGGYRIQGHAAAFISAINGSYATVMGLPIHRVCTIVRHYNETH
ncbi:MAG: septum formation protein Maf [Spirochaetaceae bacterium]|nr:MAG: septum formation protein Maf [Spirochaetaceae bacterium]